MYLSLYSPPMLVDVFFVYYCAYHSGVASIHDGSCVLLISLNIHVAHVYDHWNHDNHCVRTLICLNLSIA